MKPVSCLSDSSLRFHAADALAAEQANPDNPKAVQFLMERKACLEEQERRDRTRRLRAQISRRFDRMTLPIRQRRCHRKSNDYERRTEAAALFNLFYRSR